MNAKAIAATLMLLIIAVGMTDTAVAEAADKRTDRLLRAESEWPDLDIDKDDGLVIWVYFRDKGLTVTGQDRALAEAGAALSDRAKQRRGRQAIMGAPLVDRDDLPVAPAYIEAVTAAGARVRQVSRWLNAVSCVATPEQIAELENLAEVTRLDLVARRLTTLTAPTAEEMAAAALPGQKATDPDKTLGAIDYGHSRLGLEQIGVTAAHATGVSGAGVTIAIFDTGFDFTHESVRDVDVIATWDFVDNDSLVTTDPDDTTYPGDHGTQMLSIVAGFSPGNLIGSAYGASTLLARTEDITSETEAEEDNWVAAIEWAEGLGADIVCSGVGYYGWYNFYEMDGGTAAITVAAEMASARGVCVVNSVGNERPNPEWPHLIAPADGRSVIAVGAVDPSGFITAFSSPGPTADGRVKPDVLARGSGTAAALPALDDVYWPAQGADIATALVAGVTALLKERAPQLTPTQVAEALRETASRSLLPDNDYGWGVINAHAALEYWTSSIDHTPLPDQESGTGSYPIEVQVTGRLDLGASGPALIWRANDGDWRLVTLTGAGDGTYAGVIPAQPDGRRIDYYIQATNQFGYVTTHPAQAPAALHSFFVGVDTTPPTIVHYSLSDQTPALWPPLVRAEVTDNMGVDRVDLFFSYEDGPFQGPFPLQKSGDDWVIDFPVPPGTVPPGFSFNYLLMAWDTASSPQMATSGPHTFDMVDNRGRVLFVNDRLDTETSLAVAKARGARTGTDLADKASGADLAQWLIDAGWSVETVLAEEASIADFRGHDVIFVSSGRNAAPLAYGPLREAMLIWEAEGQRLLVEGGDVAYAAEVAPELQEIRTEILHMTGWGGDDGRDLGIPPDFQAHPFHHRPHALPINITVGAGGSSTAFTEADIVVPDDQTQVFLQTSLGTRWGGILAFDDNTGPDGGQIIFMPFDVGRIEPTTARLLLVNTMTYLTLREPPGPSSISGTVTLAGESDHAGIIVTCSSGHWTTTAGDGSYTIDGLWGGSYEMTADFPGYLGVNRRYELLEGEVLTDSDFFLVPVFPLSTSSEPDLAIPDNNPAGIDDVIDVAMVGTVGDLNIDIDISHYSSGNLMVTLTSPSGTTVCLHDRSGGLTDDVVGNWPDELYVDGPGSLADFQGEPIQGAWTLNVSDRAFGATGRFNTWALNLQFTPPGYSPVEDTLPAVTRLLGNAPNPFNPRTTISYELATAGSVRLDVFDLRGRLVNRLVDGVQDAGRHTAVWNGLGTGGAETASGVYFCRLTANGATQIRKMMLVR